MADYRYQSCQPNKNGAFIAFLQFTFLIYEATVKIKRHALRKDNWIITVGPIKARMIAGGMAFLHNVLHFYWAYYSGPAPSPKRSFFKISSTFKLFKLNFYSILICVLN